MAVAATPAAAVSGGAKAPIADAPYVAWLPEGDFFISGTAKNVIIDVRNEDTPFSEDIDFPCRRREGFCLTFAPAVLVSFLAKVIGASTRPPVHLEN